MAGLSGPASLASMEIEPRSLRLRKPLTTSYGVLETRDVWLVRLRDEHGRVGVGEAAPMAAVGTETRRQCAAALYSLSARRLSGLWRKPAGPLVASLGASDWEAELLRALPDAPAARAGVDAALWDLAAQQAGVSMATLLRGGPTPDSVPVNALVSDPAGVRDAMRAGFSVLKAKITGPHRATIEAILEAAPGAEVRLDANGCFADAAAATAALADLRGVTLIEQPVPAADVSGLAALRGHLPMLVAADESISSEAVGLEIIAAGAVDVLVLKPARLGGLGPCLRLVAAARAAGLDAYVTTMLDGAVGRAGALHLAAAIHREGGPAHGLATGALLAEDLADGPTPRRGRLVVPTAPGLGVVA